MKGTVRSLKKDKRFGFIESEGKDVFLHISGLADKNSWPRLREGMEVEFDLADPEPSDGPKAVGVTIVSSGPTTPSTAADTSGPTEKSGRLTAMFEYGKCSKGADGATLGVWIAIKRHGKPAGGLKVTLEANGTKQVNPAPEPLTKDNGTVFFRIYLAPETAELDLRAEVEGEVFTDFWQIPEAPAEPPKPTFKPTKLDIEDTKITDGRYQLTVSVYNAEDNPGPAKIRLVFNEEVAIDGKTNLRHDLDIPADTGTLTVEVQFSAERVQYDAFVLESDIKQKNRTLLGPKPKRKPAKPGDGLLAHLTDGWE